MEPSLTDQVKKLKGDLLENIIGAKREVEGLMNLLDKLLVKFSTHENNFNEKATLGLDFVYDPTLELDEVNKRIKDAVMALKAKK